MKNSLSRLHLDLRASPGAAVSAEVERLEARGGERQTGLGCESAVSMCDPDGNEFCLCAE